MPRHRVVAGQPGRHPCPVAPLLRRQGAGSDPGRLLDGERPAGVGLQVVLPKPLSPVPFRRWRVSRGRGG